MIDPVTKLRKAKRDSLRRYAGDSTYTHWRSEAEWGLRDLSPNRNDFVLHSGRYATLSGGAAQVYKDDLDSVTMSRVRVLVRSGSDGTFRWQTDAGDGTVSFTADGLWRWVELLEGEEVLTELRLGTDGVNFWSGDIGWIKEDSTGLDIPLCSLGSGTVNTSVFDRGAGLHFQTDGCTWGSQEGLSDLAIELENYLYSRELDGTNDYIITNIPLFNGDAFDITLTFRADSFSTAPYFFGLNSGNSTFGLWRDAPSGVNMHLTLGGYTDGSIAHRNVNTSELTAGEVATVRITHDGSKFYRIILNGVTKEAGTLSGASTTSTNLCLGSRRNNNTANRFDGLMLNVEGTHNGVDFSYDMGPTLPAGWSFSSTMPMVASEDRFRTPPQTALMDWNKPPEFNGTNQWVDLDSTISFGQNDTLEFWAHPTDTSSNRQILSGSSNANFVTFYSTNRMQVRLNSTYCTWTSGITNNTLMHVRLVRSGSSIEAFINGSSIGSRTANTSTVTFVNLGTNEVGSANFFEGALFGFKKNGNVLDVSGTVQNGPLGKWDLLIPANGSTDALGSPIQDPRNGLNWIKGESYGEIADSLSLDVTTEATWAIVIDGAKMQAEGGVIEFILHRLDFTNDKRVWLFSRSASFVANDGKLRVAVSLDGTSPNTYSADITSCPQADFILLVRYNGTAGTVTAQINGVDATVSTVSGSVPASLFATDIGVRGGIDFDGANGSDALLSTGIMVPYVMSEAEGQKVYSALKKEFGTA